jgi:hypothetical protein
METAFPGEKKMTREGLHFRRTRTLVGEAASVFMANGEMGIGEDGHASGARKWPGSVAGIQAGVLDCRSTTRCERGEALPVRELNQFVKFY